jgi:hypothetical protein
VFEVHEPMPAVEAGAVLKYGNFLFKIVKLKPKRRKIEI